MAKNDFSQGLTKEELNMIFLLDTSGSMTGERINQLNVAMSEALNALEAAAIKEEIQLTIRVIEFNNYADWIIGKAEEGIDISEVASEWKDLTAKAAGTNTADAIHKACESMHTKYLGTRNFHPIVILITDGDSNSPAETRAATKKLKTALKSDKNPEKEKVQCIAVGVIDANHDELVDFASIGNIEHADGSIEEDVPMVFHVDNVYELANLLKGIAVSSIFSTIAGDHENGKITVTEETDDEEDWEE